MNLMELKKYDLISISYCRNDNLFNTVILSIDENEEQFTIRLTKDFSNSRILKDSAIVCGIEKTKEVYLYGCIVENINFMNNEVVLRIYRVTNSRNKRGYERFPVSMYADFSYKKKRFTAYIKDISYSGIGLFINHEFSLDEKLELRIHVKTTKILKIVGTIKRKLPKNVADRLFEYGLEIEYKNIGEMNAMKKLLEQIREERENLIRKLVDDNLEA